MAQKKNKLLEVCDESVTCVKEENKMVWEKRLTLIVITLLIGYIANIAGDIAGRVKVMEAGMVQIVKVLDKQEVTLKDHQDQLYNHDRRLTTVETKLDTKFPIID